MATKLILSDTEAQNFLRYLAGYKQNLAASQQVWLALGTNDAAADKSFTEVSPTAANNYARVLLKQSEVAYPDVLTASGRKVTNHEQIVFNKVLSAAYTAKSIALYRVETGGTPYAYGTLEAPVTCAVGSLPMFERNYFELTVPDGTEA